MTIKDWNIEAMTGYKPITTFYQDFSIADRFGKAAIRDTLESMGYIVHDNEAGMYHLGGLSITWDKRNKGKDEN